MRFAKSSGSSHRRAARAGSGTAKNSHLGHFRMVWKSIVVFKEPGFLSVGAHQNRGRKIGEPGLLPSAIRLIIAMFDHYFGCRGR